MNYNQNREARKKWRSFLLERQLWPSAGCTGSLLDASGHAHTCSPSGVGMQKWLHPPLFNEHAFFTPAKRKTSLNYFENFTRCKHRMAYKVTH